MSSIERTMKRLWHDHEGQDQDMVEYSLLLAVYRTRSRRLIKRNANTDQRTLVDNQQHFVEYQHRSVLKPNELIQQFVLGCILGS